MSITLQFKSQILDYCESHIQSKLHKLKHTISDIVESLESETRSTAGDKHETDRAMMDIQREQLGERLAIVEQQHAVIKNIRQRELKASKSIHIGSLVLTSNAMYYIAVSLGAITINGKTIYVISKESPIGVLLMNKTEKDQFIFNGQTYDIKKVV